MLTESGCLPNRHRVTGSFSQTEKQEEGNITNQHNRQSPGFTLNPTTDLIQGKLHSTVSPLPFKICRRTRKTRKILFFPCSSLRVKVVWKAKRTLHLLFFFRSLSACSTVTFRAASWHRADLDCSIQHAPLWGSRVTELNFIKNGTEKVMNCDEEEIRARFPLTTESCTWSQNLQNLLCVSLLLLYCLFRDPLKQERKLKDLFIATEHPLKPVWINSPSSWNCYGHSCLKLMLGFL